MRGGTARRLAAGLVDLYEATLESKHLDFAIALAEAMIARFYDAENGGFWQSIAEAKDLILRVKDDYDGAEPSGNSVATLALLKLAAAPQASCAYVWSKLDSETIYGIWYANAPVLARRRPVDQPAWPTTKKASAGRTGS